MEKNNNFDNKEFDDDKFVMDTIRPYILETVKKHGMEFTEAGLIQYLILGNPKGLSRVPDSNGEPTRNSLKYIDIDAARRAITKRYGGKDISEAVELFIREALTKREKANEEDINKMTDTLAKVTTDTYLKYGQMNASLAVGHFLLSGFKNYFTRLDSNGEASRDLLNTVDYIQIRDFLIEYTGSNQIQIVVDKFIDDYVVSTLNNHYKK